MLGLLMEARDEDGQSFDDGQVRDQVLTLLFAGHDTTTSTVAFMFYELARDPEWAERLAAERATSPAGGAERRPAVRGDAPARHGGSGDAAPLPSGVDRPAAGREDFEFAGHRVPAGFRSTTPPGRAIACPRCFRTRTPSTPSGSSPRHERSCPRAPTSPSAPAPGGRVNGHDDHDLGLSDILH